MADIIVTNIKKDLSKLFHEYMDTYNKFVDIAYKTELQNVKAGDRVPEKNGLKTDDMRAKFNEAIKNIKGKAIDIIDSNIEALKVEKTAPPSTEATNYITLLKDRGDLTESEITDAINTYGDNYSALKALYNIARDNKLHIPEYSAVDTILNGLEEVKANVQKMSAFEAERSSSLAPVMFDSILDISLPSDEWKE